MGDPDGTLDGARRESQAVHDMLKSKLECCTGANASMEKLVQYAPQARVLHLATHGKLNPDAPQESYLLLAHDSRLKVIDAMNLPLQKLDLAVLSACESGVGGNGMEYATLARSFALAGTPSLVATLWKVPDAASEILITAFYRHLENDHDIFRSLAAAQREMLSRPAEMQHPSAWSGFIAFGKP